MSLRSHWRFRFDSAIFIYRPVSSRKSWMVTKRPAVTVDVPACKFAGTVIRSTNLYRDPSARRFGALIQCIRILAHAVNARRLSFRAWLVRGVEHYSATKWPGQFCVLNATAVAVDECFLKTECLNKEVDKGSGIYVERADRWVQMRG